jgi:hypothetical protein
VTPDYRDRGILWLRCDESALDAIAAKGQPVLLFVGSTDSAATPALRALLRAMPQNAKLRDLLHEHFSALFIEAGADVPDDFEHLRDYAVAVLSPVGLTPLVTIDPMLGAADEVVDRIVEILEQLRGIWR